MITDTTKLEAAKSFIFSAPVRKLGVRRQASRDMYKPAATAALFAKGGRYEIHASRTDGRMRDMVWCYVDGVLAHEGVDAETCRRVIEIADKVAASR